MKRIILYYHILALGLTIGVNILNLFSSSSNNQYRILAIIICGPAFYWAIKHILNFEDFLKTGSLSLFLFNLIQVFVFSISGIMFKIICGLTLVVALKKYPPDYDLIFDVKFSLVETLFYIDFKASDDIFYIGINLFQFIMVLYLFNMIKKGKKIG